jgi:hypothetical protein
MRYLIVPLGLLIILGACAPKQWTCIIDVAGDSQCKVVPCDQLQSLCTEKHRLLKNYPAMEAVAYTPTTDYRACMKNAGQ